MSERVAFQVDGEWLTDYLRKPYWEGSITYEDAVERVCELMFTTQEEWQRLREEVAPAILMGTLRLEGVNNFTLVADDKESEYHKTAVYKQRKQREEHTAAITARESREIPLIENFGDCLHKKADNRRIVKVVMWSCDIIPEMRQEDVIIWAIPDSGMVSEYGLISPTGDWYSCDFAAHNSLACHLVERDERLRRGCINKYPDKYDSVYDTALRYLCDLGWLVIRNPWASGAAYPDWSISKYLDEDDLPQCMLNTLYAWKITQHKK